MEIHVHKRRAQEFDRRKALVEIARCDQLVQQRLGHGLASLGMNGEAFQHCRLLQPMLEDLRRKLDKILRHIGAGKPREAHLRQHAVQRVAEFVEQRLGFVEAQKRGLAGSGFGEIAIVDDERRDGLVDILLIAEARHPGPAALGAARIIIAIEQSDMFAALRHLPHTHVRVIDGHICARCELKSEQSRRGVERGLDHPVELEIGHDLAFIEIVARLSAASPRNSASPMRRARNFRPLR